MVENFSRLLLDLSSILFFQLNWASYHANYSAGFNAFNKGVCVVHGLDEAREVSFHFLFFFDRVFRRNIVFRLE